MCNTKERYDNIMFLRVIACVGVLLVHMGQRMELTGSIRIVTDFGSSGVKLFFIISGFLAYSSYERYANIRSYWFSRILKILPAYYAVIIYYYLTDTYLFKCVPTDETTFVARGGGYATCYAQMESSNQERGIGVIWA